MKSFSFFALCFVLGTMLCGFMEGTAGICATTLTANISANVTTIPVESTVGFPSATYPVSQRYIVIRNECVSYASVTDNSFVDCVRGLANPRTDKTHDASSHKEDTLVMNVSYSAMNNLIAGVMQAETVGVIGTITSLVFGGWFWDALWQMLTWNYSFFTGQLIILRIILIVVLSGGFLFGTTMAMVNLGMGILKR